MSKNYPTRMHEVLGVAENEEFYSEDKMLLRVNHLGRIERKTDIHPCVWDLMYNTRRVEDVINRGIIRKPRLSEEQVKQLRALVTLGFRWLIKNRDCSAFAYTYMPKKMDAWWEGENAGVQIFIDLPTGVLYDLVSWSDPAPLDIVATLKANGVEIEEEKA